MFTHIYNYTQHLILWYKLLTEVVMIVTSILRHLMLYEVQNQSKLDICSGQSWTQEKFGVGGDV